MLSNLRGFDPDQVLKALGELGVSQTHDHFQQETGPGGTPWEPSKRAETDQKGKTLQDTARLKNSIHWKVTRSGVVYGTNVEYGPVHQYGFDGQVQVQAHQRDGSAVAAHVRKMKMPERPFLFVDRDEQAEMRALIMREMARLARVGV